MTVLTACNSAAVRLRGKKVTSVVSTTDLFSMELADLANETAADIAGKHDWQALTKEHTLTGTGAATSFPLPADYLRMLKKGEIHSGNWQTLRFRQARDLDQWLDFQTTLVPGTPGRWILLGGLMQVLPAMALGEVAKFYYISKNVATSGNPTFQNDADGFVLPERLLTLGVIWRWRAQKRLEFAEDMANYEIALSEAIGGDRATRPLIVGRVRMPAGVDVAWPGTIVP